MDTGKQPSGNHRIQMVEHNARAVLEIARRGYVPRHGVIVISESVAELLNHPLAENAYLGGKAI